MRILSLNPADLVEMPGNENVMQDEMYASLVRFVREKGFKDPILVRDLPDGRHGIVDGRHRKQAALELGLAKVPCVSTGALSDADAKLMRIGLNRHRGDLDLSAVGRTLAEIIGEGASVAEAALSGYSEDEVRALVDSARGGPSPDDLAGSLPPPPPEEDEDVGKAVFVLEIAFGSKADHDLARRTLRRAGGGDLAVGLSKLIQGEEG